MEFKDKKAVLGLDTAKLFILAILALVIISVVTLIVLDSVGDITPTQFGGSIKNITTATVMNETGAYVSNIPATKLDCFLTITEVWGNATLGTTSKKLDSANYTVSGCQIIGTPSASYNNSIWNITGTFTNSSNEKIIVYNTSTAMSQFFNDVGTWFTLIGVVIIILIIAVVIVVINRFGTNEGNAFAGSNTGAFS